MPHVRHVAWRLSVLGLQARVCRGATLPRRFAMRQFASVRPRGAPQPRSFTMLHRRDAEAPGRRDRRAVQRGSVVPPRRGLQRPGMAALSHCGAETASLRPCGIAMPRGREQRDGLQGDVTWHKTKIEITSKAAARSSVVIFAMREPSNLLAETRRALPVFAASIQQACPARAADVACPAASLRALQPALRVSLTRKRLLL